MSNQEIIKEVKAIRADLMDDKLNFGEAIEGLRNLSESINVEFTDLYNAFYSSTPEIYFS